MEISYKNSKSKDLTTSDLVKFKRHKIILFRITFHVPSAMWVFHGTTEKPRLGLYLSSLGLGMMLIDLLTSCGQVVKDFLSEAKTMCNF